VCYFTSGFCDCYSSISSSAWWISDRPKPPSSETPLFNKIRFDTQAPPPKNVLARINSHPLWLALSADIFTGQIIASLIVLTFVAVFLLREWISQNARPGVFEDEEPLPDDPQPVMPLQPQPLGPVPGPPAARLVFANPQHRRPLHPLPPVNAPAPRPIEVRELQQRLALEAADLRRQHLIPPMASDPSRWDIEGRRGSNRRPKKKKNKVKQSDGEDDDSLRAQRKMEKDAEVRRKMFHRRIHMAKSTAVRQRMTTRRSVPSSSSPLREVNDTNNAVEQKHEFTFTSSLPESSSGRSSKGQSRGSSVDLTSSWQSLPAISTPSPATPTIGPSRHSPHSEQPLPESPFPSVTLQPPSGSIPFSLRSPPIEPPPPYPSRPVLPTSPLPRSGSSSPFLYSPGRTNLDSPTHSTYLAPEELVASFEAGPSDYFARENGDGERDVGHLNGKMEAAKETETLPSQNHDSGDDTESLSDLGTEDIQAEHDRYFGDAFDTKDESGPAVSLELLTDSESDVTTTEDGGIAELDEEDRQPPIIFWDDGAGAGALRDGVNARGEGNIVHADPAPQGQAAVAAALNQPPAEGPAAANAENDEADANVEDDMEGAMEG